MFQPLRIQPSHQPPPRLGTGGKLAYIGHLGRLAFGTFETAPFIFWLQRIPEGEIVVIFVCIYIYICNCIYYILYDYTMYIYIYQ